MSLVLAGRGDPLNPHLFGELAARYPVAGELDAELRPWQRMTVAAATFRVGRSRWAERFFKSGLGYSFRRRNAASQYRRVQSPSVHPGDAVLQVHTLFDVPHAPSLLYVDCTHEQSARNWPQWNPLRGRALDRWYAREQAAYQRAAHVFAFCQPTRRSLIDHYGISPSRISVVGSGVNFAELPAVRPYDETGPPTVLFVGNDFVRKGGPILLDAFAQVRRHLPQARLQLVGALPRISPQPGVEVLGRITDRDVVAGLFARASVFCLPSFFDPMPLVLLEAMAHRLPCISTRTCGVPEMVSDGESGLLVDAGDVAALTDALLAVLTQPELARRLGARGRVRVEEQFTWSHVVDRMAPVLDRYAGVPVVT